MSTTHDAALQQAAGLYGHQWNNSEHAARAWISYHASEDRLDKVVDHATIQYGHHTTRITKDISRCAGKQVAIEHRYIC